jgi:HAE1 family hydrophobic/amphiphilic exporter-1
MKHNRAQWISLISLIGLVLTLFAAVAGQEPSPTSAPKPDVVTDLPKLPAVAPDYRAESQRLPELGRVGVDLMQQKPLTLREAITLALENNRDIEVARHNVRLAEFDLSIGRAAYLPRLGFQSFYEQTQTPPTNFFSGVSATSSIQQSNFSNVATFSGLTPRFGGSYQAQLTAQRTTSNNSLNILNPQYPETLTLSYTQPLLRGRRYDQTRRNLEVARKNLSLTDAQFRQKTIEIITNVQRAYWDLVFTLRSLQVQRDAVRDARRQLEHNKRLVSEGVLAPLDIVSAEAQVAAFEQNVYVALDEVNRAENSLKNLLAENREAKIWGESLIPTDNVDLEPPAVAPEDALTQALANRPELQQSDLALEINRIDQRLFRDQTKVQADLVASYGAVGNAGARNPNFRPPFELPPGQTIAIPSQLEGGYTQSFGNLLLQRYNNFRVGVTLNLPLREGVAKAQLGRSLVEGERLKTQREQLEQLIQVDVRNALQTVRTAQARLRAAAAQRAAAEQQYASEQRKFDAAQSTVFLVLERQTALTNAKSAELRAQTDLNKALAELQRATGNSLQANDVVVRAR